LQNEKLSLHQSKSNEKEEPRSLFSRVSDPSVLGTGFFKIPFNLFKNSVQSNEANEQKIQPPQTLSKRGMSMGSGIQ